MDNKSVISNGTYDNEIYSKHLDMLNDKMEVFKLMMEESEINIKFEKEEYLNSSNGGKINSVLENYNNVISSDLMFEM